MKDTWWVNRQQLDDEQKDVLEVDLGKSHLVLGPPGSGKTNLLLLRANFSTLAGRPNVAIVVFTRVLREFIAAGGHAYAFDPHLIYTSQAWLFWFIRFHGGRVPDVKGLDLQDSRRVLVEAANQTLDTRRLAKVYQTIFVDEAQDLSEAELQLFQRAAEDLFIVADSRQQIYRNQDPLRVLNNVQVHRLTHNYRNGHAICRVADAIASVGSSDYELMVDGSNYNERGMPSSVDVTPCADLDAQIEAMLLRAGKQIIAYPGELIGVIAARRDDVLRLWNAISSSSLSGQAMLLLSEEDFAFDEAKPLCVSTIHSTKGLEFRCLHVLAGEAFRSLYHARNVAYTAVTRAKTVLSFYHSGPLPPFLRAALTGTARTGSVPSIDALFGTAGEVK
jgi:DNA helicase IV